MPAVDVVVVGAGIAGAFAAQIAAQRGLRVRLLERNPRARVGDKVCGDGIEIHHFTELGIPLPPRDVIQNRWSTFEVYSPDRASCVALEYPGILVDRLKFGQHLLTRALDAGAEFRDAMLVLCPLRKDGCVAGVVAKDKRTGEREEVRGKLVIDASGFHSPLRKAMESPYVEARIAKRDFWVCYREILRVGGMDYDLDTLQFLFGQKREFVGYAWVFPKGADCVSAGIVVYANHATNVKASYEQHHKRRVLPHLQDPIEILHGGGGVVPVRRPLWSLVEDGILFAGDAACQVNPLHGGGIGSSMRAGIYAAETATHALERGDSSIDGLWEYNQRYARDQGGHFASLDLFRIPFSRFTDEEINYTLQTGIVGHTETEGMILGKDIQLDPLEFVATHGGEFAHPKILSDLYAVYDHMERMKKVYRAYPDRAGFERWRRKVARIYKRVRRLIRPRSIPSGAP